MSEDVLTAEDQSHYEISLTAGQAFIAFVLLLLSLAASFAFGLLIGKGQAGESLLGKKEPAATVITESPKKAVVADDFKTPIVEDEAVGAPAAATPAATRAVTPAPPPTVTALAPISDTPAFAQLLSSSDQHAAEALATKLIDAGFNSAYVERGTNDKGAIYRVRVKFPSEADARAAEAKLKEFSKEVWITTK
jgi:cell division septation protein DedD